MSRQITLELPDEVLSRAERLATLSHRDVRDVLAEAVAIVLPPLDVILGESLSVSELSDNEVLKLTNLQLKPAQDQQLSQLLDKQQAGTLTKQEQTELLKLMQIYETNLLRQAEALAEAARRQLIEPLLP